MDEMRLKGVRLLALPVCTTLQSGRFGSSSALTHSCCLTVVCGLQVFTEQNLEFQEKILERSGLGDETGLSDGIAAMKDGDVKTTLRAALDEDLLARCARLWPHRRFQAPQARSGRAVQAPK